ncbi:GIP [Symbiodinium sp. CCMP2456]|nr:GIP [Symbiodinium sp. CCMP2456]
MGSPVSFAPQSDLPLGVGHWQSAPTALERFVRAGDLSPQMGYEVARMMEIEGLRQQADTGYFTPRLSLDPGGVITDFDNYRFQRVESRAVSLLLAAIPQGIKEDLITNRRRLLALESGLKIFKERVKLMRHSPTLILAECESASLVVDGAPDKKAKAQGSGGGQAMAAMVKAKGKGKGGKGNGDNPPPCHNFSNAVGCRFGDTCRFHHDRAKARKDRRCLCCGQSGHYRPECTVAPAEFRQGQGESSPESASPKSPEPKKPAAKPKPKAGPQAKGVSEDASSVGAQASQGNGSGNQAASSQQELLAEAQKLLKGMSLKTLSVRDPLEAFGIDKTWLLSAVVSASNPASASDMSYALVDSGATNGLREARPGEWDSTQAIQVDLASGVAELHVNGQGTLLSPSSCQVIIPAGWLIELGLKPSEKLRL